MTEEISLNPRKDKTGTARETERIPKVGLRMPVNLEMVDKQQVQSRAVDPGMDMGRALATALELVKARHELGAQHTIRKARIILNRACQRKLAALLYACYHHRLEVLPGQVDCGGVPCWAGSHYYYVFDTGQKNTAELLTAQVIKSFPENTRWRQNAMRQ